MRDLPTGLVTFLFTDIEGSTRLWESDPAGMRLALARHDALIEALVEANDGAVVRPRGEGDSRFAVFAQATSGVAAAAGIQQALYEERWPTAEPLRVRMAVHTGEADLRLGDYYGATVNRCARLRALAYGGQTIISAATMELVRDGLPHSITLDDLDEHRLKDLVRPERVYQLSLAGLPNAFPPLKSLDTFPNNLPIQLTSFIGREVEIEATRQLLASVRLLTLIGAGGTGKTRLALQLAAEALPDFSGGVWLAELAPLTEPAQVIQAIASIFELHPLPGGSFDSVVTDYLRAKHVLLILDNCEHLIDACAQLADRLLRVCPHLKIIASSREGLGIAGEALYRIPSLSLPDPAQADADSVMQAESTQLFVARASAAQAHFTCTQRNAPAVIQICRRLDGIPLALELAAARVSMFSAEQIASRLGDRFRLLTGGSRTAVPRQQTLRAMIDWSYDLLSESERVLLRRLAVFAGSWSFEAAEGIAAELDVLVLLTQLVNKSLVIVDDHDGATRYRLLETIRQYARDRLFEAGEAEEARDRHVDYFLAFSEELQPKLRSADSSIWLERLETDYDNVLAAFEWSAERRPEDAVRLIRNQFVLWRYRSHDAEVHRRLQVALERLEGLAPVEGAAARRRAAAKAGGLMVMGSFELAEGAYSAARAHYVEVIEIARLIDDKHTLANSLLMWCVTRGFEGDFQGILIAARESIDILYEIGDHWALPSALVTAGHAEMQLGDRLAGQAHMDQAARYLGKYAHPGAGYINFLMGMAARMRGDLEQARGHYQDSANALVATRYSGFLLMAQSELGHIARQMGDLAEAKAVYQSTLPQFIDRGNRGAIAHQLESIAFIAHTENHPQRAATLLSAADGLRDMSDAKRTPWEQTEFELAVAAVRSELGEDDFGAIWAAGRTLSLEQGVSYALSLNEESR